VGYTLLVLVLLYAAALRFDAVIGHWGMVPGSVAAEAIQTRFVGLIRHIRPEALDWRRFSYTTGGDPYAYLQEARERTNFYAAHLREPLFVFSVRFILHVLGQADIAGAVTSGLFSWLTVVAIYLIGSATFNVWVGLGAAAALSIERDVIGLGAMGYRDDAFAFFVVLTAYGSLMVLERPSRTRWAWWGVIASAACLTRLTALSFVLPAGAYLMLPEGRVPRDRSAAVGLGLLVLLTAPFLINCYVTFGAMFYPVTGLRSAWNWEGGPASPTGMTRYLFGRLADRPFAFLDALATGAISMFSDRWHGFDGWPLFTAHSWLSALALVGLLRFPWSTRGRLLLLILVSSSLPVLFIRDMPDGNQYRYGLHVYPFLLVASFAAVDRCLRTSTMILHIAKSRAWSNLTRLAGQALITTAVAVLIAVAVSVLPYARMLEDLHLDGQTIVVAGPRDALFFRRGWYAPVTVGNVTARASHGRVATLWIPMLADQDATMTIRMDPVLPANRPPPHLEAGLNGAPVAAWTLSPIPDRMGTYVAELPHRRARGGLNRLELTASSAVRVDSTSRPAPGSVERVATYAEEHRPLDLARAAPEPPRPRPASFDAALSDDQQVAFRLWYVLVRQSGVGR